MDIEFARTFLTVIETRSFAKAAELMHVTQSTVSARIKVLEDQLGQPVFIRSKAGVTMTAAGAQFEPHASALVRIWQLARQTAALPEEQRALLTLGAQPNLWDGAVIEWMAWLRRQRPAIALRADSGSDDLLMRRLVDGLLDVAVVYTPQTRSGISVEALFEDTLIMLSSIESKARTAKAEYVFIDWGTEFRTSHAESFPGTDAAALHFANGIAALSYIRRNGGRAYFPLRLAKPYIDTNLLHPVAEAPQFHRTAYAAYYTEDRGGIVHDALSGLRRVCKTIGTHRTASSGGSG